VKPTLYATPPVVQELAASRAAAILVGGYDGSGNYGDIAQLEAARELVGRLGPDLVVLPLLERRFLQDHRALTEQLGESASQALYFDPGGELEDDLVPAGAPAELAFGACYLYGGGYLNRFWGDRKLAMLHAAVTLLEAGGAGSVCRVSSGLQVESGWIGELGEVDAAALRSFIFLGVRDRDSGRALDALDPAAPVSGTADDAVGILRRLPVPDGAGASNGRLHVNLHFAEHDWVSSRPEAVLDFYARFVAELGRFSGRPVVVRPLIAYLDGRIDERPGVERLAAACNALGVEVSEPLVLRPAVLAAAAPGLTKASLTLSCSYHVALTSLMLKVPAVLLHDNAYYAQKAAGLAEDFRLPAAFTIDASGDPLASAREIADVVLDEQHAPAFRHRLATEARRQCRRRATTEAELLTQLGGAAVTALSGRIGEVTARLRERSGEPARLHAQLASLQADQQALRLAHESRSPLEAESRAQEAEARAAATHETLAALLGSRSWRMLAPLRRAGKLLRRLKALLRRD
jgi:hypothetical protein